MLHEDRCSSAGVPRGSGCSANPTNRSAHPLLYYTRAHRADDPHHARPAPKPRRKPRRQSGEIGHTRIAGVPDRPVAEVIHTDLPEDKEDLERYFAERFIAQFNQAQLLGAGVVIADARQNDTSDLDFSIKCAAADYLELAEINPRSEAFGRSALRDGKLNVYTYSRWIYFSIIRKKMREYGTLSRRVILLLYVTHWQFLTSERVVECVRSLIQHNGCHFAAAFIMLTDGHDLKHLQIAHPYVGPQLPASRDYEGFTYINLEPGHHAWKIDI